MQAGEPDILKHANPVDVAPRSWDKRTALRSTMQRAAMTDALRCDGRCTALQQMDVATAIGRAAPRQASYSCFLVFVVCFPFVRPMQPVSHLLPLWMFSGA